MNHTIGPIQTRRFAFGRHLTAVLVLCASVLPAIAQDASPGDTGTTPAGCSLLPDIFCFSGSPLLLQVNVPNPDQCLESIAFKSEHTAYTHRVTAGTGGENLQFYLNPFLAPGSYEFDMTVESFDGESLTSRFDLGFVDFVWGRDNLNFGNNSKYVSVIGSFGTVLEDWLEERFGEIAASDLVLFTDYMYGLFGKNTGRCYAFAGTEVRYWRWPELLPTYYNATHDLKGYTANYQREMAYLQFDIVFNHFVAGPGFDQISRPMDAGQVGAQTALIKDRINAGEPVAVGFAGPDLHHSMLVFGYIQNRDADTFDLLVANNWKNDEKLNIHSRDAEIVRVFLAESHEGPRAQWRYEDGIRKREIDRLFVVDVERDSYEHDRRLVDGLSIELRQRMLSEGLVVIVVEDATGARLVGGERSTGWIRHRITNELDGVWYERVGDTFRFTYPVGADFELEIADTGGARLLRAVPGTDAGDIGSTVVVTDAGEDGELVYRRFDSTGMEIDPVD